MPEETQQQTVLVVDDDREIVFIVTEILRELGLNVVSAEDGPKGLRIARTVRPSAILCDVVLPGMTGFEIAAALRADPAIQHIPVIFITGYPALQQASPLQGYAWILKPFSTASVRNAVEAVMRRDAA